jgi:hypothetical protein
MESPVEEVYAIPASYRKMENTHILFWLLKDISWCMVWKPLGIAMIVPTLGIAIVIAWRTRSLTSELAHNLAIVFWIMANSYWMLSEFFGFDTVRIDTLTDGKHLAIIPFGIGLLILAYYYLVQKPRESRETKVATL